MVITCGNLVYRLEPKNEFRSPLSHSLYYYDGNYMWKPCVQIGTEKRI